jgi:GNAT superfamily N-acetyltransferase
MAVKVLAIDACSKRELKRFIRFNDKLYRGNPYAVPELYFDTFDTLSPKKNAAFSFCEAQYFLAYRDDELVGRVAAIINHKANKIWGTKTVRFGWIDFIDDLEVSKALLDTVAEWGKERGMEEIEGPFGFTDFDPEGMLTDGFDQLGTLVTIYNYAYYPEHMRKHGLEESAKWIEMKLTVPDEVPEKHTRVAALVKQRYGLRTAHCKSVRELANKYGKQIFNLLNEAYACLYGYSELSPEQIELYIDMYVPILDRRMISMVVDSDDNLVAVGISMPSLSEALQKGHGMMFPFGWWHLLKALFIKRPKVLDLMMVAVKPELQNKGINALLMEELVPNYKAMGFEYGETNPELVTNTKVQSMWEFYKPEIHKRRATFKKSI